MAQGSNRLRGQDLRAIYLLVGECCELGADPLVWRRHMLERLNAIFGAVSSIDIEAKIDPSVSGIGAKVDAAMTIDHFSKPERELMTRCLREMPMEANPLGVKVVSDCPPGGAVAAIRSERVSYDEWIQCQIWTDYFDPIGWDDMMVAVVMHSAGFRFCNLTRRRGDARFPARSARVLELFVRELAAIPPTRLAPMSGASLFDLPPRQRDVLTAMAQGDNEKQIAARLGITRNTVHEHVRRLFERYGVASRGELLVRAARQLHALDLAAVNADDFWFYQQSDAKGEIRNSRLR